mmetsp:Transcript_4680/g.7611  ORF Transcript_4680/g.7611 Transcript_4680/m.7611 type:complete len:252 (-) Transcript_4680:1463-2218(-)
MKPKLLLAPRQGHHGKSRRTACGRVQSAVRSNAKHDARLCVRREDLAQHIGSTRPSGNSGHLATTGEVARNSVEDRSLIGVLSLAGAPSLIDRNPLNRKAQNLEIVRSLTKDRSRIGDPNLDSALQVGVRQKQSTKNDQRAGTSHGSHHRRRAPTYVLHPHPHRLLHRHLRSRYLQRSRGRKRKCQKERHHLPLIYQTPRLLLKRRLQHKRMALRRRFSQCRNVHLALRTRRPCLKRKKQSRPRSDQFTLL